MLVHCVSGFEGASLRAAGFFCFFRGKDGPLFAKTVSCSMSSASSMLGLEARAGRFDFAAYLSDTLKFRSAMSCVRAPPVSYSPRKILTFDASFYPW